MRCCCHSWMLVFPGAHGNSGLLMHVSLTYAPSPPPPPRPPTSKTLNSLEKHAQNKTENKKNKKNKTKTKAKPKQKHKTKKQKTLSCLVAVLDQSPQTTDHRPQTTDHRPQRPQTPALGKRGGQRAGNLCVEAINPLRG